jgi:hypothetical protein
VGVSGGHRHTNSAIELRWATTTHTILPDGLDGALFDSFIASKASKVVARKIKHLLPGADELGSGSVWSRDDWYRCEIILFFCRERSTQRFWCPFIHELVDFLKADGVSDGVRRIFAKKKRLQTYLLGELDKMLFASVCASTRLQKNANGEKGQEDFEDGATGIVLVGRFYIAGDYM